MENTDNIERVDLEKVDWWSSREFFESLGEALDKLDDKNESYNFTWVGKRKSIIEASAPINKTLRPDIDASKDFDNTKNMLIVGDNLDALKLLQESYLGKIKMIYIDPPYNTGHDFVYHDNFTVKKNDYEDNTTDSEGNKIISEDEFTENSKSNGRFHSDWLSMMYPRLKLARNLLSDSGVFVSNIDENELQNYLKLLDEVFSEDNNLGTIVWDKRNPKGATKGISYQHEYIVLYARNTESFSKKCKLTRVKPNAASMIKKAQELFKKTISSTSYSLKQANLDFNEWLKTIPNISGGEKAYCKINNSGRVYRIVSMAAPDKPETRSHRPLIHPITNKPCPVPAKGWRFTDDSMDKLIQNGKIEFGIDETSQPNQIYFLDENSTEKVPSLLYFGGSDMDRLKELEIPFDTPKIVEIVKSHIQSISTKDSIILDFFAGSGTTGHAVMDLNAEDGGNRKYILVQLDEPTDDKSEAKKAGYSTIDQITAERLRRAGDKIIKEHPDLEGKLDTGFRVFRIDSTNENEELRKPLGEINQSELFNSVDNIKKDRSPLDLLFGIIYISALPFDLKLETRNIGDNTIYLYGYLEEGTGLVACFDNNIPEGTIKEIAKLKPLTAAFKDSSFTDSAAKINLSEHFRIISPDTKVKVI